MSLACHCHCGFKERIGRIGRLCFSTMHIRNTLKVQFVALILLLTQSAQGARVFFTDQPPNVPGYVISVNCDGTDQRTVVTAPAVSDFRGIAYHASSNRVYYLDNGATKRIYSMMPDEIGRASCRERG